MAWMLYNEHEQPPLDSIQGVLYMIRVLIYRLPSVEHARLDGEVETDELHKCWNEGVEPR